MINAISLVDLISFLASSAALAMVLLGWRRALRKDAKFILAGFLGLVVFHDFGNLLEWSGLTSALDAYGDYAEFLIPFLWGTFFYCHLQVLADRELRESRERFRSLVETTSDLVWEIDDQGRFTYVSPRSRDFLGYDPEQIIGKTLLDLTPPGEAGRVKALLEEIFGKGEPFAGVEWICHHKDGRHIHMEAGGVPFLDDDGTLLGYRGVNRDVTGRKRVEETLMKAMKEAKEQNRELQELDKIKDGIIRDVSHELKAPVAKMAMQMELLQKNITEGGAKEEAHQLIDRVRHYVKRQEEAIRNILDLSRLEAGGRKYNLQPVPLHEVLAIVLEDYGHDCRSLGISLVSDIEPMTVEADRDMLWHVFSNLINNAIKFSDPGGEPRIELALKKQGGNALVTVRDNGIGLSEEEIRKVFDRFYKAQPVMEGSGVGLTISRMIVEDLGGTIWLESPGVGKGTTVFVRL